MLWKKIETIFFMVVFLISCANQHKPDSTYVIDEFIKNYSLSNYEYWFIIHFSPHDCISCLHPLEHLEQLQKKIEENGNNTFIAVSGNNSEEFWSVYNGYSLTIPVIKEIDLYKLNFPYKTSTPVCYFYDATKRHLIYCDILPREENTFLALVNLVEKYSGVPM